MKYYVLYCNYGGAPYEIGYGKAGLEDKFFNICRDKHGFDKYGQSYDEDTKTALETYQFDTKEEVIEFVADSRGVISFTSPEDRIRQQLQLAKDYVENTNLIRL